MEIVSTCLNCAQRCINIWFTSLWGSFTEPLLTKYYILVHFCVSKELVFGPLLHSILLPLHGNSFRVSPAVRNNGLIYGLHQFGGVTGPLSMKYYILVQFAGQKAGFQTLTS